MSGHGRHVNCPASLSSKLTQEFNNRDFSDVKLIVGKEEFYAHRMLLATQSDMFRIMFNGSQWLESTQKVITLNESKECEAVFHEFLVFFYGARIHLTVDNIVAVRILADKYQHHQLLRECDKFIAEIISRDEIDTVVSWLVNISSLGEKMENKCLNKLRLDFIKLMTSDNSRGLVTLDLLIKIVDGNMLLVCNEFLIFNLVATWIMERRHASSQKSAISKLLPLIHFPYMSIDQLNQVEKSPLATKYTDLIIKYIFDAYKGRAQVAQITAKGQQEKEEKEKKEKEKEKEKDKDKEKEKDKSKDKDKESEKYVDFETLALAKVKGNLPMPRIYTDTPWGNGYTKPIDAFLSNEYEVCNFTCPVVDRAAKPCCVTKKTDLWEVFYKREIKTYMESEDQVMTRVLVSHDFSCKYKIPENPKEYEIFILTGYIPNEDSEEDEAPFTALTTKKHVGTVKTIGNKSFSRRRIKFTEILKPVLLAGNQYVFSLAINYKE